MTTSLRKKLNIFISHNHGDDKFGHRLVEDLRGVLNEDDTVFYDSKGGWDNSGNGLRPGDRWQKVITEKLAKCNIFIILLSKAAVKSDWVDWELNIILNRVVKGRVRILAICLEECKVPIVLGNVYQLINYSSPSDYGRTFNEVLRGLGIPPLPDNPDVALTQNILRQIVTAYDCSDWHKVVKLGNVIDKRFPELMSLPIYLILARALLELGELQQSQLRLDQIAAFELDNDSINMLDTYADCLVGKELWEMVVNLANYMLQKLQDPNTNQIWLGRKYFALNELEKKRNNIFQGNSGITPSGGITGSFPLQANPGMTFSGGMTGSFPLQANPGITPTNGTGSFPLQTNPGMMPLGGTKNNRISLTHTNDENLSSRTTKLSEVESIDPTRDSLEAPGVSVSNISMLDSDSQKVSGLKEMDARLESILNRFMPNEALTLYHFLYGFGINLFGMYILIQVWKLSWWLVFILMVLVFAIYCWGLFVVDKTKILIFSSLFSLISGVIWLSIGVLIISFINSRFNWDFDISTKTLFITALAFLGLGLGFRTYIKLFGRRL